MSVNKIIGVKRERKKGAVVGALSTVCMSLTMRERRRFRSLGLAKRVSSAIFFPF